VAQSVAALHDLTRKDGGAGEARDERVPRRRDEVGRGRQLQHRPLADHADAVCERRRVLEVVGDEDRGETELVEQLAEIGTHARRVWASSADSGSSSRSSAGFARGPAREPPAVARRPTVPRCAPWRAGRCGTARAAARRPRSAGHRSGRCAIRRGAERARTPGRGSRRAVAPAGRRCPAPCPGARGRRARRSPRRADAVPDDAEHRRLAAPRRAPTTRRSQPRSTVRSADAR
jgi:hypothetical protein